MKLAQSKINRTGVLFALFFSIACFANSFATKITATPANYTTFINGLIPGDTLYLTAGNYLNGLTLTNINGTATQAIVITGETGSYTSILVARSCCNTVSITKCSYVVIKNLKIDGKNLNYIDGVNAGGAAGNWAHHITLENLYIINNGGNIIGDNQTVGISTKCSAWNWTIRGCTIIAAGTGLYLGNSNGAAPFVSGIIENNLVINTKGYNMQIKLQLDNVRDDFAGTSTDFQKTIIRYNVFSKDSGATPIGTGDGARPCLLMDNFPKTGFGANDMYEVYGNFFYNNPTEALMQVTGNTTAYNNVFVNHVSPSGYNAIVMNSHNGFPPRKMNFFHNTVLSQSGGVSLSNRDAGYNQYCYGNAIFSAGTPISGFGAANMADNVTDTYANAGMYVNSPSTILSSLDMYPKTGQLQGALTSNSLFTGFTDYDKDFNGDTYNWIYRGAYSGAGTNKGWHLKMELRTINGITTSVNEKYGVSDFLGMVYPNPADNNITIEITADKTEPASVLMRDLEGRILQTIYTGLLQEGSNKIISNLNIFAKGFYLLTIETKNKTVTQKFMIAR